jgi:hypothetical protein
MLYMNHYTLRMYRSVCHLRPISSSSTWMDAERGRVRQSKADGYSYLLIP